MSMMENVRAEMVSAMKSGDKKRKDVLSLLLSDLKAVWIDKRADLTEAEENDVVRREMKQTKETMETAKDRPDILEESRFTLSVLKEFAPQEMSEAEIRAAAKHVLQELGVSSPSPKDRGRIMKGLMPKVKGRADGGTVSRIVAELCAAGQ